MDFNKSSIKWAILFNHEGHEVHEENIKRGLSLRMLRVLRG